MRAVKTPFKILIIGNDEKNEATLSSLIHENYTQAEIFGSNNPADGGLQLSDEYSADVVVVKDSSKNSESIHYLKHLPKGVEKKVVYITENDDHALDALKLGVRDLVLDPNNSKGLKSAIDHVVSQQSAKPETKAKYSNKILVNRIDKAVILDTNNILFVEADGPYTTFHMIDDSQVKSSKPMGYYLKIMADSQTFIKVNRSICLNFDHILELVKSDENEGTVILTTGKKINLSANMKNRLLQKITELLSAYSRV